MKLIHFSILEKLTTLCKKARFFPKSFRKFAFYGLDMEPEPEPEA
jgi:hypothetical protein